jgi:hypothetical protein
LSLIDHSPLEEEVLAARRLRERGLVELGAKEMAELLNTQGSDSVGPKCEELARMVEALESGLERRARALELSRQMHAQIGKASSHTDTQIIYHDTI